jgi:hypothetical protein
MDILRTRTLNRPNVFTYQPVVIATLVLEVLRLVESHSPSRLTTITDDARVIFRWSDRAG